MSDIKFGFRKVTAAQKTEKVTGVFESVANAYDLMNDLMSFGIHRFWKSSFVESLPFHQHGTYLDMASGTGDIANAIQERLKRFGFTSDLIATDINQAMIGVGKKRHPHLNWTCANAEELPIKDQAVDVATIAFGLRNVTHIEKALKETYRVLKPGGVFACLEFSQVEPPLGRLYDLYSFKIIPKIGKWVANDEASYQYLSESIRTFLTREELANMMKKVGFQKVSVDTFLGGIVAFHKGYKPN